MDGTALQHAIDSAVQAISDSRTQVVDIAKATAEHVSLMEQEYELLKNQCLEAIDEVERREHDYGLARQRLVEVNRDVERRDERAMRAAYKVVEQFQVELTHWREREYQLRLRRDEVARRLKLLRETAHQAELLMVKFSQVEKYLQNGFASVSDVLENAKTQSLVGLRLLQLQEEERRMLAQRLHDDVMQELATVALRAQSPQADVGATNVFVRGHLNQVIGELRHMVFDLRPPLLDDLGLLPTMRRYVAEWSQFYHRQVDVQFIGVEVALQPTEKITIFRAIQEGLRNIVEHAPEASSIVVRLTYGTHDLVVDVMDNGEAPDLDWNSFAASGRMGLILCQQRLAAIGGTLLLEATRDGTRLRATVPIHKENDA